MNVYNSTITGSKISSSVYHNNNNQMVTHQINALDSDGTACMYVCKPGLGNRSIEYMAHTVLVRKPKQYPKSESPFFLSVLSG